jgi:hypothetical protein
VGYTVLEPGSAMSLEELLSVMKNRCEGEHCTVAATLSRVWYSKVRVKQFRYRAGVTQRVPGSYGSQISLLYMKV